MATPPLQQVGKYKIVDVLGEGAMGVVYRAYDQVLNRYLAIKVMNTAIGNSAQLRERFLREARAAGSLQHPNVVTIYDFGEAEDHLFIAMEFVDGEDLSDVIKRRKDMPITMKLDVMIDMLNGLAYAHNRGVVHRDIKPANIRLTMEKRAKLMDFGIAHLQQSELTQSGVLIGTPQYMAPEQVSGGAITTATDVFAAGSVLYEFLSYRRPFEGDTLHVIMYNIMSADPPPISEFIQKAPSALTNVLAKAMAKDPAQRYPSAVEMSQALAAARQAISPALDAATLTLRASSAPSPPPTALRTSQIQSMIADEVSKGQKRTTWRMLGLTAVAVGATVVYLKPWDRSPADTPDANTTSPPTLTSGDLGASPPADSVPPAPTPATGNVAGAPGQTDPERQTTSAGNGAGGRQGAGERTATQPPITRSTPTRDAAAEAAALQAAQQAAALMATARGFATDARRNAQTAGATTADLAAGDRAVTQAEAHGREGRNAEAAQQYQTATQAFNDAANTARNRAAEAARAQGNVVATPPRTDSVVRQSPPAAVDHRPAIQQVIANYSAAIAAEDIAAIRRAFPTIPDGTRRAFEALFGAADRLKSTYTAREITISGTSATVPFSGVYEFYNSSTRRDDTQRFEGTITLERTGDTWRITSVR